MNESLRLFPFLSLPLERVVPDVGAEISGTFLPGGTVVGCLAKAVHHDRLCFGEDVDCFRPERWLIDPKADEEEEKSRILAMQRGSLSFGSGKRICLGRHLAELEIKKIVPCLLQEFEVFTVPVGFRTG